MTSKLLDCLSKDLSQLLEDPTDYNVSIEIGEAPNNQIFKVHSYILQSRSPYFKKKFNETPFNDDHVKVFTMLNINISIEVFSIIIKYIYGGIISLEKLENSIIYDILIASNEFKLYELVEYLQTYLVDNRASWLKLKFTQIYQSYQVKNFEIILEFYNDIIAKHPSILFESEKFYSLSEDELISVIKRDNLQLVEGKVWEYTIQWGKAKNPTLPTSLDEWTSENFLTLRECLKQCLPHIRYFSISGDDVIKKIYPYQQLLEHQLFLDINTKLISPNNQVSSKVLPARTIPCSSILTVEHSLEILSWIDRQEPYYTGNTQCHFELLVKGSRDGFDVKNIYDICDKVSNTVIVLKVEGTGEILGGYNPLQWNKEMKGSKPTCDSFAFSLKTSNLRNSILSRVKYHGGIGFYSCDSVFSFGHTLVLRGNLKTSKLCYCRINGESYDKPIRSAEFLSLDHKPLPSNKSTFNVEEYEIFKVSKRNDFQ
ncbi:hypothetical protein Glove_350g150 [Diversispora epigaea]|uniref:BTB domain-containing protein n=1 Tax=Diversispora epigaea TaxID=1348612 RepID=A0A397HFU7_9GLOM|nr:hypothetical protein Glove_350g150 [Diversispora epigaea]